jgi:hypothetical protein
VEGKSNFVSTLRTGSNTRAVVSDLKNNVAFRIWMRQLKQDEIANFTEDLLFLNYTMKAFPDALIMTIQDSTGAEDRALLEAADALITEGVLTFHGTVKSRQIAIELRIGKGTRDKLMSVAPFKDAECRARP